MLLVLAELIGLFLLVLVPMLLMLLSPYSFFAAGKIAPIELLFLNTNVFGEAALLGEDNVLVACMAPLWLAAISSIAEPSSERSAPTPPLRRSGLEAIEMLLLRSGLESAPESLLALAETPVRRTLAHVVFLRPATPRAAMPRPELRRLTGAGGGSEGRTRRSIPRGSSSP